MRTLFRTIYYVYSTICALFFLWVFLSWADVVMHNASTHIYQPWNCFTLFLEVIK